MSRAVVVLLTLLALPGLAQQTKPGPDGHHLLHACDLAVDDTRVQNASDALDSGYCMGLVHGVAGSLLVMNSHSNAFAQVGSWRLGQSITVVDDFLHAHPELLNQEDVMLVSEALWDTVRKSGVR